MHLDSLFVLSTSCGLALLCGAALHDMASRTVPNGLAAAVACCGIAARLAAAGPGWSFAAGLGAAFAVFFGTALLWRRGWMGGGDVKLLGAAALLCPASAIPTLVCATALAGGVLALPYLAARRRLRFAWSDRPCRLVARAWRAERWRLSRGGPMPYAVAIACGAMLVLIPDLTPGAFP